MPKIPSLPPITTLAADDEFPVEDTSASTTKRSTLTKVKEWLQTLTNWINSSMISTSMMISRGINAVYIGPITTLLTNAYATYATVTGTTEGNMVKITAVVTVQDGGSGAARFGTAKVDCDGVDVTGAIVGWYTPTSSNNDYMTCVIQMTHTPTAASHTWRIRVIAGANTATYITAASLHIEEINA